MRNARCWIVRPDTIPHAALRDTLLPKLIFSELRVMVGEPYVAEAVP